ncbi:MAG: hypothetical protein ABRQ39_32095, partial [Candidatus Eremiobacterota bacterium]
MANNIRSQSSYAFERHIGQVIISPSFNEMKMRDSIILSLTYLYSDRKRALLLLFIPVRSYF